MSGLRRIVPVAEQGASRRTASNGSGGVHSLAFACTVSALRFSRREVFLKAAQAGTGNVHRGDLGSARGKLGRLSTGRGAKIRDAQALHVAKQKRGQGGGGILHPPCALLVSFDILDASL